MPALEIFGSESWPSFSIEISDLLSLTATDGESDGGRLGRNDGEELGATDGFSVWTSHRQKCSLTTTSVVLSAL